LLGYKPCDLYVGDVSRFLRPEALAVSLKACRRLRCPYPVSADLWRSRLKSPNTVTCLVREAAAIIWAQLL
jgi:hypothetical protein